MTPAHLSDRSARFGLQPAFGRPLLPECLAKALLLTLNRASDWGCAKPLLTALLQLAHSEPTGTNRLDAYRPKDDNDDILTNAWNSHVVYSHKI